MVKVFEEMQLSSTVLLDLYTNKRPTEGSENIKTSHISKCESVRNGLEEKRKWDYIKTIEEAFKLLKMHESKLNYLKTSYFLEATKELERISNSKRTGFW